MTHHLNVTSIALAALESPTHREAKRATHDGWIWPVPRHEMKSPRRIRERIAEDAERLLSSSLASVTGADFIRLGWQATQLIEHGLAALRLLRRESACGNDPMETP